jgi:16S rRNA processing protein RimM
MSGTTHSGVNHWVELGRLGAPQGLHGWMRIQSFASPPEALFDYPEWRVRGGGAPTLRRAAESRVQGRAWLVRLEGIESRDAAQALTGAVVEIERSQLPKLGEHEYYQGDLIGCRVSNLEGVELGTVTHFVEAPAHPVMALAGTRQRLVPATREHLRSVDLAAKTIMVDWPEDF